jgi:hypothetical protein
MGKQQRLRLHYVRHRQYANTRTETLAKRKTEYHTNPAKYRAKNRLQYQIQKFSQLIKWLYDFTERRTDVALSKKEEHFRTLIDWLELGKKRRKPLSDETRQRMSLSKQGERNSFYGKTHKTTTKAQISAKRTGRPLTREHSEAIANGHKGVKFDDEHRTRISVKLIGRDVSLSSRQRMSLAAIKRKCDLSQ